MNEVTFTPIAVVRSPFKEKFATPRQPGLTPTVTARIELLPDFARADMVRKLDTFSHIWLIFIFHQHLGQGWHPTVRPPRLGGNQRVGVLASRSPFRPNPVGLSAVRLRSVQASGGVVWLEVEGADLIDGTPIIDIKPYIPYADSLPQAAGGFAPDAPGQQLTIAFSKTARRRLQDFSQQTPELEELIRDTLRLDPRPAYRQGLSDHHQYGCRLDRYNIRWHVEENTLIVIDIELISC